MEIKHWPNVVRVDLVEHDGPECPFLPITSRKDKPLYFIFMLEKGRKNLEWTPHITFFNCYSQGYNEIV